MASFKLDDYIQVNERIMKFYEKYPEGSIQTEIIKWENGVVVMKAYAYRTPDDARPATGHAYEKEDASYINKTSALENCETSAVGRALAMLGFEIKKSIASKEEMQAALEAQETLKKAPVTPQPKKPENKTDDFCADCNEPVTAAVRTYCENNGFDAVYCPKCQKKHRKPA